jgi:hypothetical protein
MASTRSSIIHLSFDTFFAALTGEALCADCLVQITPAQEQRVGIRVGGTLCAALSALVGTPAPDGGLWWNIHALQLTLEVEPQVTDGAEEDALDAALRDRAEAIKAHLCAVMAEIGVRMREGRRLIPELREGLPADTGTQRRWPLAQDGRRDSLARRLAWQ